MYLEKDFVENEKNVKSTFEIKNLANKVLFLRLLRYLLKKKKKHFAK